MSERRITQALVMVEWRPAVVTRRITQALVMVEYGPPADVGRMSGQQGRILLGEPTAQLIVQAADWEITGAKGVVESDPSFEDDWGDTFGNVRRFVLEFAGGYDDASDVAYDAMIDEVAPQKFWCYPRWIAGSDWVPGLPCWHGTLELQSFNVTTPAAGQVHISGHGVGTGAPGKW